MALPTSVSASQSIASAAKSGVDSAGSMYTLESGGSATGSFSVGGAAKMNDQLLIIGAVALIGLLIWKNK